MATRVGDRAVNDAAASDETLDLSSHRTRWYRPDDRPQIRQKRKRTSPEDQAILEAAYARDPKPDKPARLKLVEEVALGEKEVQIWFQNRRQSSRRKSRPLLPHEVAQYQISRATNASQLNADSVNDSADDQDAEASQTITDALPASSQNDNVPAPPPSSSQPIHNDEVGSTAKPLAISADQASHIDRSGMNSTFSSFQSTASPQIGYLANRRSALLIRQSSFEELLPNAPTDNRLGHAEPRRLRKSTSLVRISMTSEGNAEITTKDTSEPSPPRLAATSGAQAQFGVAPVVAPNFTTTRRLQRSSSGRSRDSRAWEFWCDKEARSELGHAAEMDASGSATGAIGLLRSASGRSILGSLPSKRNSLLTRNNATPHAHKRSKTFHSKSSLQRSRTSFGRLQTMPGDGATLSQERPLRGPKHKDLEALPHIPGNESDKENWSPGGEGADIQSAKRRRDEWSSDDAVNEQTMESAPKNKSGAKKARGPGVDDKDFSSDSEIALGRKVRKSASVSSEDDLDCIQGLLSLSQGNWR